jgi:hypothetical protein
VRITVPALHMLFTNDVSQKPHLFLCPRRSWQQCQAYRPVRFLPIPPVLMPGQCLSSTNYTA